jgi:hypothetical protein
MSRLVAALVRGLAEQVMDLERFIVEFDPAPLNFERWAAAAR